MTVAQLCVELNIDEKDADRLIAEKWRTSRFAVFDKVCGRFKLSPIQLSTKRVDEVAEMIRAVLPPAKNGKPAQPIDASLLPARITEYLESQRT